MMHVTILCLLLIDFHRFPSVKSDRISSKLDFGDDSDKIVNMNSPENFANVEILKQHEGTTIICSSSGCNKTKNQQEGVVSDVVVHVKTSVPVPKIQNETIAETPDVPVVLGYGRNNPHPQYNPDSLVNSNPVISVVPNAFPENTFVPIFEPKPRVHHSSRKFFNPNYKQVSFDTNFLYIPYIEPSFHNYHYGEQPPLQYVWTPKDGAGFNPVEFKRFDQPTWNKVQWNNRPVNSNPSVEASPGYTTCTCHNPGLNWYPTTPTWNIEMQNRNSRIDDKLAPLN